MNDRLIRPAVTLIIMAVTGCTSWSRVPENRPAPSRGTVEVWSGGQPLMLRDPKQVGDSLVGWGPDPDTTRRAVARSDIDSLRIHEIDPGKVLILGTGVAIAALLVVASGMQGN